ncbi:MAG: aldolase/citrate lyase family protein [Verrucomicrobiota bacterium]
MRRSKVLEKIRAGEVARICALGHYMPYFPRLAAHFGYDGIWVDGEHRAFDPREAQALIAFHHLADIDCIWRTATLEKTALYRFLEEGATALMIPHVSTVEKAKMLSDAVKFPPLGDRGIDGSGLDSGYYVGSENYVEFVNRETFLVVQIETPEAIQNVDKIAAVPAVEVLFLGPGDLSLRLGCGAELDNPQMMKMKELVANAAKKHGKAWGQPVSNMKEAKKIREMGGQFIVLGNEFLAVHAHLQSCSAELDEALGGNRARPEVAQIIP